MKFEDEAWFRQHSPDQQKILAENTRAAMECDSFVRAAKESKEGVPSQVLTALSVLQIEPTLRLKRAIGDAGRLAILRKSPDAARQAAHLIHEIRDEWEQQLTGQKSEARIQQRDKKVAGKIAEIKSLIE